MKEKLKSWLIILKALSWIWLIQLVRCQLWNIQTNGQWEKWEVMNELAIPSLCSNLKDEVLARALTFWLTFLHSPSTCCLKVSLLSFFIPKVFHCTYLRASHCKYPPPNEFFITKKKVKIISIYFHAVILKPQNKAFRHTLSFINYFQFWTTH